MTATTLRPSPRYGEIEDETGATVLTVAAGTPNTRALAQQVCDRWNGAGAAARHVDRLRAELHAARKIIAQLSHEKRDLHAALDAAGDLYRITKGAA
ncbi:hypothetical protein [Pikeienuella sp. HZG-20]|uniref:hypothetical protein n=1 Tax=Paludibacillus litoralis TaxID=3133267 RepID=UPI0030ECB345